ncbi:hypothetical protein [Micromonospora sp. NPDC005413]|uniref:hypothetical protein n=1 Tax=Micromonospora sp. NPDC005413 TaxID=3154563 RepID=UPI0033B23123
MRRCLICPAAAGQSLAIGWTTRTLRAPVIYRSALGGGTADTPAGEHRLCPTCSAWLPEHRDRMLPPAVLDGIEATVGAADLHPATARRLRLELVGMVRHLAEALTQPGNTTPGPA